MFLVGYASYDTIRLSAYEMLHRQIFTYRHIRFAALILSIWLHFITGVLDLTSQSFGTLHLGQFFACLRAGAHCVIQRDMLLSDFWKTLHLWNLREVE
jgi:hypothetical protein